MENINELEIIDAEFKYKITKKGLMITGCQKDANRINIPRFMKVDGDRVPVYGISKNAFKGDEKSVPIIELTLPEGLQEIGDYAFDNRIVYNPVFLPNTLVSCGMNLNGCPYIYIPKMLNKKADILSMCSKSNYKINNVYEEVIQNEYYSSSDLIEGIKREDILNWEHGYYIRHGNKLALIGYDVYLDKTPSIPHTIMVDDTECVVTAILGNAINFDQIKEEEFIIPNTIKYISFNGHLSDSQCRFEKNTNIRTLPDQFYSLNGTRKNKIPKTLLMLNNVTSLSEDDFDLSDERPISLQFLDIESNDEVKRLFIPKSVKYLSCYLDLNIEEIEFEDGAAPIYVSIRPVQYFNSTYETNFANLKYNHVDNGLYLGSKDSPNIVFMGAENIADPVINVTEGTKVLDENAIAKCTNLRVLKLPISLKNMTFNLPTKCFKLKHDIEKYNISVSRYYSYASDTEPSPFDNAAIKYDDIYNYKKEFTMKGWYDYE